MPEICATLVESTVQHYEAQAFARDPFANLAERSRNFFSVYNEPGIEDQEKDKRLDSFFRSIEASDRAAFPSKDGVVEYGVPDGYLPDGFIDLGAVDSLTPAHRYGRAMNYVDTYATLHRHKELFAFVFGNIHPADFNGPNGELRYQQTLISNIATEVYRTLPYGDPIQTERGGILPISSIERARCQHHGLVAQVLLQAFGIRSRLSKNYFASEKDLAEYGKDALGGDHVSNIITIVDGEEKEYMLDTTNPQLNDKNQWMFGLFRMNQQTADGDWLITTQTGGMRKYTERGDMHWTIQR